MDGQTAIPVPDGGLRLGPCRWCGERSVTMLEIEPAKMGMSKGTRICKKPALEAPVCNYHSGILGRQPVQCTCHYREPDPRCRAEIHNA